LNDCQGSAGADMRAALQSAPADPIGRGDEKQPGLDSKKFAELFKSFSVVGKAKRAAQLTTDYQVAGVPALGVAGRWYVDGDTAGSLDRALQAVDFLVIEARKG